MSRYAEVFNKALLARKEAVSEQTIDRMAKGLGWMFRHPKTTLGAGIAAVTVPPLALSYKLGQGRGWAQARREAVKEDTTKQSYWQKQWEGTKPQRKRLKGLFHEGKTGLTKLNEQAPVAIPAILTLAALLAGYGVYKAKQK